jgi:uncharacterized MAPEG superfamily protein
METLASTSGPYMVLLSLSVVLLFVHIGLQGILATKELGSAWNAGPRDEGKKPTSAIAGRADRALANYKETYPAFIGLLLGAALTGDASGWGLIGGWIWFAGRIGYIPLYLLGIPYIRSLVWMVSAGGLVIMLLSLI